MKDKLMELADEMEACWICASIGEGEITLETINNWSGRLSAILDAEGDGVAVAWVADLAPGVERPKEYMGIFTPYKDYADHLAKQPEYVVTPLYTNPARSGVVSDEDVKTACRKYYNCGHPVYPPVFEGMRAALESYERNRK